MTDYSTAGREGHSRERGITLLITGFSLFVVIGMVGLAFDLGRMYIAKNETQTYVDAAAIAAALELDGTIDGLNRARDAVANNANHWNFQVKPFSGAQVEFAQTTGGPWEANPSVANNYGFVRVNAGVSVPLSFIRAVASGDSRPVNAVAVAGQVIRTGFREGLFPFSPFAHDTTGPDYGLVPGQLYTLRWASNPKVNNNQQNCPGDQTQAMIDLAQQGGGEERGFIESDSASLIRQTIIADYQTVFREIGDSVVMTGGAKQTQRDALVERVRQDTDNNSVTYAEYLAADSGNFRRVIAAPINVGHDLGYTIVQIGAFLLLPESYYLEAQGGNKPFCAEYIGAYLQGGRGRGAYDQPGYYVVRLVQ
jgi:Flp pilus assembly protein TadG